jgi:hypothetical protein
MYGGPAWGLSLLEIVVEKAKRRCAVVGTLLLDVLVAKRTTGFRSVFKSVRLRGHNASGSLLLKGLGLAFQWTRCILHAKRPF